MNNTAKLHSELLIASTKQMAFCTPNNSTRLHRTNDLLHTAVENDRNEARMDAYKDKQIAEGSGQPEWWEAQDDDKESQQEFLDSLDDVPF